MSFDPITYSAVKRMASLSGGNVVVGGGSDIGTLSMVPVTYTGDSYIDTGSSFSPTKYPELSAFFRPAFDGKTLTNVMDTHAGKVPSYNQVPGTPYSNYDTDLGTYVTTFKMGGKVYVSYFNTLCVADDEDMTNFKMIGHYQVFGILGTKVAIWDVAAAEGHIYDLSTSFASATTARVKIELAHVPGGRWASNGNTSIVMVVGGSGVLSSSDLVTWKFTATTTAPLSITASTLPSAVGVSDGVCFVGTSAWGPAIRSIDGGNTWTSAALNSTMAKTAGVSTANDGVSSIIFSDESTLYVVKESGGSNCIFKMASGDTAWSLLHSAVHTAANKFQDPGLSATKLADGRWYIPTSRVNLSGASAVGARVGHFVDLVTGEITPDLVGSKKVVPSVGAATSVSTNTVVRTIGEFTKKCRFSLFNYTVFITPMDELNDLYFNDPKAIPLPSWQPTFVGSEVQIGDYAVVIQAASGGWPSSAFYISASKDGWSTFTTFQRNFTSWVAPKFVLTGNKLSVHVIELVTSEDGTTLSYEARVYQTTDFSDWKVVFSMAGDAVAKVPTEFSGKGGYNSVYFASGTTTLSNKAWVATPDSEDYQLVEFPNNIFSMYGRVASYGDGSNAQKHTMMILNPDRSVTVHVTGNPSSTSGYKPPIVGDYKIDGDFIHVVCDAGGSLYSCKTVDGGFVWDSKLLTLRHPSYSSFTPKMFVYIGDTIALYMNMNNTIYAMVSLDGMATDFVGATPVVKAGTIGTAGTPRLEINEGMYALLPVAMEKNVRDLDTFRTPHIGGTASFIPEIPCDLEGAKWAVRAK